MILVITYGIGRFVRPFCISLLTVSASSKLLKAMKIMVIHIQEGGIAGIGKYLKESTGNSSKGNL